MNKKIISICCFLSVCSLLSSSNLINSHNINTNSNATLYDIRYDKNYDKNVIVTTTIENYDEPILEGIDISNNTLLEIYKQLVSDDIKGKIANDKLVEFVANEVLDLANNPIWKARYNNIIKCELENLMTNEDYYYNNIFDEDIMRSYLLAQGYKIVAKSDESTIYIDDLVYDYTDYINKKLNRKALTTLLKEKYVYDVLMSENSDFILSNYIKSVEWISLSTLVDNDYEGFSVKSSFESIRDRIVNNEVIDFTTIQEELYVALKKIVEIEYNKIGTSIDYSGKIKSEYSNYGSQSPYIGYQKKLKKVEEINISNSEIISKNTNVNIIDEIISSVISTISDPTDNSFYKKIIPITDNNLYYYLVSPLVIDNISEDDILLTETLTDGLVSYSIVRFKVLDKDSNEDDIYDAVKLLSQELVNDKDLINYYIDILNLEINVYDDVTNIYLDYIYSKEKSD